MIKSIKFNKYKELFVTLTLLVCSFVIFNLLFNNSSPGSYYQNLISALIGTLLTVTITAFLLKKQSKTNEMKERNVEVFKKKVERYEKIIKLLSQVLEDGKIDEKEAKEIKSTIYDLALFSSEETIEVVSKFLRHEIVNDHIEGEETTFFHVISQFRKDLQLDGVDDFSFSELDSINSLLNIGFDKVHIYNKIYMYFKVLRATIKAELRCLVDEDELKDFTISKISGSGGWIEFSISHDDGILEHIIAMDYPKELKNIYVGISSFNIFDLADMKKEEKLFLTEMDDIGKVAKKRGFRYVNFESDDTASSHHYKSYPVRFLNNVGTEFRITSRDIHMRLVKDILSLEMFNCCNDHEPKPQVLTRKCRGLAN